MGKVIPSANISDKNAFLEEHPQIARMPRDQREWNAFVQTLQRWKIEYEGTLSVTIDVGFAGTEDFTVDYFRYGKIISLIFNGNTGSSDGTTFSMTGVLPEDLRPAKQQTVVMPGIIDNGSEEIGYARIQTNGDISFALNPYNESGFTASGTKGINGNKMAVIYTLHDSDRIT